MKKKTIFIIILLVAFLLRFIGLEKSSPPLNRDEAGIGYNAYSLLLTGKDEHGSLWSLSFKSIGDYKMPGYIYLSIIPIKFFGLNISTTRFWSAFSGFLAILLVYFLTQEISQLYKLPKKQSQQISLFSAFLLSINPWHIHYSRIAFEANVNLTLFLAALFFLFKSFKKPYFLFLSTLFFLFMQLMYSSTFIFLPIFLLSTFFILKKSILKINKKILISNLLILFTVSFLITKSVFSVSGAKSSITYFSDPTTIDNFNHIRGEWNEKNPLFAKIFFNKYIYFAAKIIPNFIKNLSPGFLFLNKINHPWHSISGQGFFYYIDGLFFISGIIYLVKIKNKKIKLFLLSWLLTSPIASAITIDAPHATRSLFLIPAFLIISAFGFVYLSNLLKSKIFLTLFIIFYLFSFSYFIYAYFIQFPKKYSQSIFEDINKPLQYLSSKKYNKQIYFTNVSDSVYLYILFFNKIDPSLVQKSAQWKGKDAAGLIHIEKIENYHFVSDTKNIPQNSILVLQNQNQAPANFKLVTNFENKYNKITWQIYSN